LKELRRAEREQSNTQKQAELDYIKQKREEKKMWDYSHVIKDDEMYSNKGLVGMSVQDAEEDFM
jgi:hypothetical protein